MIATSTIRTSAKIKYPFFLSHIIHGSVTSILQEASLRLTSRSGSGRADADFNAVDSDPVALGSYFWRLAIPIFVGLVLASQALLVARLAVVRCPVCKAMLGAQARAILRWNPTIDILQASRRSTRLSTSMNDDVCENQ
jgi:hypothetical protein